MIFSKQRFRYSFDLQMATEILFYSFGQEYGNRSVKTSMVLLYVAIFIVTDKLASRTF